MTQKHHARDNKRKIVFVQIIYVLIQIFILPQEWYARDTASTRCVKIVGLESVFVDFDIRVPICPGDRKAIAWFPK